MAQTRPSPTFVSGIHSPRPFSRTIRGLVCGELDRCILIDREFSNVGCPPDRAPLTISLMLSEHDRWTIQETNLIRYKEQALECPEVWEPRTYDNDAHGASLAKR